MSGIVIPWLGYLLMGLATSLLLIPGWRLITKLTSKANHSKMISIVVVVGIIMVISAITIGVYYKTGQNQTQNEHRPILVLDVTNLPGNIDETQRKATMPIDFIIKNIGDRPAYQARFRQCAALLDDPKNVSAYPDLIQTNPVYTGVNNTVHFSYDANYANQKGIVVLIYTHLRYSDAPSGGIWYEQAYWFAYQLNLESRTGVTISALSDWIKLFEPFVDDFYAKSQ